MSGTEFAYLDTSAYAKLFIAEAESAALEAGLRAWPQLASSQLLRTECRRALHRLGVDSSAASDHLAAMTLVDLSPDLLDRAGLLAPATLRSLDAIHLASALVLGPDLGVFFTYDDRLADAARTHGLRVEAPGAP